MGGDRVGAVAEQWGAIEKSRAFYKKLYDLRAQLERDRGGYELMWGFGRLRWKTSRGAVDHPLLTVGVEIDLDPGGRLSVAPAAPAEVEATFLAELELADTRALQEQRRDRAADGIDMWNHDGRRELIKRLLRNISHDGLFSDAPPDGDAPVLADEWVLYLRRRQTDYAGFLEGLRELYGAGGQPSLPLLSLVVRSPSALVGGSPSEGGGVRGEPGDETLYLPKEANQEQHRILDLARQRAGVTAQGPPGTGKSHTIANLICHFVAEGKRVLVTAEKEQALSVLAEKLPSGVRELSVTVGGGDSQSYTRLEHAVRKIQTRVSTFDAVETEDVVTRTKKQIAEIDASIAEATNLLRSARQAEANRLPGKYEAGRDLSPSDVAAWLAETADELSCIPGPLRTDVTFPLDQTEWTELTQLCAALDPPDVEACQQERPPAHQMPAGASLGGWFAELDDLRRVLAGLECWVADWDRLDHSTGEVDHRLAEVREAWEWRRKTTGGWLDRVRQECGGPLGHQEWEEFEAGVTAAREQAMVQRMRTAAHGVRVPSEPAPELREGLREARGRFATEKGVSRVFQHQAAKALDACRVDGRVPSTAEEVDLCLAAILGDDSRRELASRWRNGTARVDGPSLGPDRPVEDLAGEHLDAIRRAIGWETIEWPALRAAVWSVGLRAPESPGVEDLDRLAGALATAAKRPRERHLSAYLAELKADLGAPREGSASPLWAQLDSAFANRRWALWDEVLAESRRLTGLEGTVRRFENLMGRIRLLAPDLAEHLVATRVLDAPTHGQILRVWEWHQLGGWLAAAVGGTSIGELQRRMEELAVGRRREMEKLVAALARRGLAAGFNDDNRAALDKYVTAVKRHGKTGGKFVDRWRREMRDALDESKDAIPVWIMPTTRALESFRPAAEPPFDVLIVDEASQIGILGLPILSLAKKAIVVGDDKQTSPENVGLDRPAVFDLIDAHLGCVRDARTLFDADNSLYDVSRQKFPEVVVLSEHFRCLPQIIAFSNGRYYQGAMVPLRDRPPDPAWQPVGTVFVPDGFRDGDINEPEALATVDLIAELTSDPRYDGMSFGFIALLGRSQSRRVQELLLDRLGPDLLEERRIRCGEAADFQGDERDVVVVSTVVDRPEGSHVGHSNDPKSEHRLNVAASRAKNQLWVVHSIEPGDFPSGDPRAELIRHCQNPIAVEAAYSNLEQRCESQFEKDVLRAILERGYRRVRIQHEVGRHRIDIVVEGPNSRLAVECDGDRYHTVSELDYDLSREQVLGRSGWTFERIRGSAFYRDPHRALDPLWQRLEELGIPTGDWGAAHGPVLSTRRVAPTMAVRREAAGSSPAGFPGTPVLELDDEQTLTNDATGTPERPDEPPVAAGRGPAMPAARIPAASPGSPTPPGGGSKAHMEGNMASTPGSTSISPPSSPGAGSGRPGPRLSTHCEWSRRPVVPVLDGRDREVIDDLVEIVAVEGPMVALRLYQVHAKAAGGARVGRQMQQAYNRLVARAVREGRLALVGDAVPRRNEKTLYKPGNDPVVLRELGHRQLHEVPRSEIRTLADRLGVTSGDGEDGMRAVLGAYGMKKLTQRARSYVGECLAYSWDE